jgi:adenine-specific DNA glycosylase
MAALPGDEWTAVESAAGPVLARIRHVFTPFALELDVVAAGDKPADGWWQPLGSIDETGLPTLYRKAVHEVLKTRKKLAA